jgi:hypothetical protein
VGPERDGRNNKHHAVAHGAHPQHSPEYFSEYKPIQRHESSGKGRNDQGAMARRAWEFVALDLCAILAVNKFQRAIGTTHRRSNRPAAVAT